MSSQGAAADTRQKLLRAGERLFAQRGIYQVRLREINALAGQRNSSALHYHFGSRDGLVEAILSQHQTAMDAELKPALDELDARDRAPSVREIVALWVHALGGRLEQQSGRDFLRILPQVLHLVNPTVRRGAIPTASAQSARTLALLDARLAGLAEPVRRERLVAYTLILTALFADRAALVESDVAPVLDHDQFGAHATDVICAVVEATSTVRFGPDVRSVTPPAGERSVDG
jgi:TetR/AcrR family transcriptional regulator, regulator of cefoperazone and chloramphenicol sensitivity